MAKPKSGQDYRALLDALLVQIWFYKAAVSQEVDRAAKEASRTSAWPASTFT